uniref:C-type lectin domain-containing protein n=1 Tax=Panagrolaimus davidi TaxID=227884 RepID=A0A914RE91_9BILA
MLFVLLLLTFFVGINATCPNGSVEWKSECYFFQNDKLAFVKAEEACNSLGGHLVSIHDGFTNAFVAQTAALQFHDSTVTDFWLGGTDMITGNWTWMDGTNFTFSQLSQTKNLTGQDCLVQAISGGKWNAQDCFKEKPYVCAISATPTNPPFVDCGYLWVYFELTGYCYGGSPGYLLNTWQDAETYCQQKGGHLASVHSAQEMAFLHTLVDMKWSWYWIGMYSVDRENTWQWTDGTKVDYINWQTRHPTWNTTSCVVADNTFIDSACTAKYQPMCKRKPQKL